jgi:hypothetical protein
MQSFLNVLETLPRLPLVRSGYKTRGFWFRLAVDLVVSNIGLLLGILTTMAYWTFTWEQTRQHWFRWVVFDGWLANVPILTVACLLGYPLSGLYRGSYGLDYLGRAKVVFKAVGLAFLLFFALDRLTDAFIPRSAMGTGWLYILTLMLASRFLAKAFYHRYHLMASEDYDPQIEKVVRELTLLSHQDGWLPPESLPRRSPWPYFENDEVVAAAAVLQSGKVNQWTGKEVAQFQDEFAAYCGVKHAIALANGSLALELALKALDIGPGDEVIVTPRTFIASASCAALVGAKPVFVDVDRDSQNIHAETIRAAITPRTRAIIAVHLAGWPCDMDPIMALAEEHGLKVIEDCAQSHGAVYYSRTEGPVSAVEPLSPIQKDGVTLYPRMAGSFGHMAAYSFCQDKIMTTGGEGGMLLTNDDALWEWAWAFKDHGKSYDAVYRRTHKPGFRWLHESFGTNWRLTEMQAAIGRRQLGKLPRWIAARRRNAAILTDAFKDIDALRLTLPPPTVRHAYYKYYAFVRPEGLAAGWDRDRIMNAVVAKGAPCFSGSCSEVYLEKAFDGKGAQPAQRLPVARELGETSLMFMVHPTLTEKDMQQVAETVRAVMADAGR